jgi:peroxiredoxin
MQLVELQRDLKDIEETGARLVGISYESVEAHAQAAENFGITFPLLSDSGSKTITALGLLDPDATPAAKGVAYAETLILDRDGVVRAKLYDEDYRVRPRFGDIVAAIEDIKPPSHADRGRDRPGQGTGGAPSAAEAGPTKEDGE